MFSIPGVSYRKRLLLLFLFTLGFMSFLIGRLSWIQFGRGEDLRKRAAEVRMSDVPVQAKRGEIRDRDGRPLAISVSVDSIGIYPVQIKDKARAARTLAEVLGLDYDEVLGKVKANSGFLWVRRKITPEQSKALKKRIKEEKLTGIEITPESKREYPNGMLAANILGIAGLDNNGLEGIEKEYDEVLKGTPGRISVEVDAWGRAINGGLQAYIPPKDGNTLYLTIDLNVQNIIERDIDKAMVETRAKGVGIAVIDVATGGILGMAMRPSYDPNHYGDYPDKNRRPWLIADALSPGSIFKPFTAAAAMDSGKVGDKEVFHDGGSIVIGGHAITNWDGAGNGSVTLYEIMQWSSNVGFAQVGLRTGVDDFYKYLDRFGLTEPTGIDLPGEGYSILPRKDRVKDGDLARMAFGQTLAVTPISALNAIATIGNDGVRMKPHLGKEVRTPEGQLVKSIEPGPVGKVVAPDVARKVQIMMERVITQGTAGTAYVPGYRTAGKTGTAQKVVGGKVSNQVFTASFVGLTPLPNPKFAVLVMVDEPGPGVSYYGGQIAAPVYKRIMTDVFRYLQIPPDPNAPQSLQWWAEPPKPADPVPVPSLVNLPVEEAKKEAAGAGFTLRIDGAGPAVVEQVPPPGGKLIPGKSILVKTVPPEGEKAGSGDLVRVPDVRGKTMRDVANTLASVDLRLESQGTGIAIGQNPAPLALVKKGSRVTVQFEPPAPAR